MKLGLENKKQTAFLGVLILVCGYLLYNNVLSGPSVPSAKPPAATAAADPAALPTIPQMASPAAAPRAQAARGRSDEFHPVYLPKRPEDRIDLTKVDPTLHLELLAKLQDAVPEEGGRNLFQFSAPPPPPAVKIAAKLGPEPVVMPQPKPAAPAAPPSAPPPPPIPLKYYGGSKKRADGRKAAFFLDGDNILIAAEGEVLEKRYRVVRINDNSVVLEDTQLKREQSLPLAEDANAPG